MQFHLECLSQGGAQNNEISPPPQTPICLFHSHPLPCQRYHSCQHESAHAPTPHRASPPQAARALLISGVTFQAAFTSQRGSSAPLIREGLPRSPARQPRASCKIHPKNPNEMAEVCFRSKTLPPRLLRQAGSETGDISICLFVDRRLFLAMMFLPFFLRPIEAHSADGCGYLLRT